MSRQRESRLSGQILTALRKKWGPDLFVWKNHGNELTMAGLPDISGCFKGRFFCLEIKMPEARGNVSAIQKLRHDQICLAQGCVGVVCSVSEALAWIEMLDRSGKK